MVYKVDGGASVQRVQQPQNNEINKPQTVTARPDDAGANSKIGENNFIAGFFKNLAEVKANAVAKAQTPPTTGGVTPAESAQIDAGVERVVNPQIVRYRAEQTVNLAEELRGKSPAYQAEFMKRLYAASPAQTIDFLNQAGGQVPPGGVSYSLNDERKGIIADALGHAYNQGKLPSDFVQTALKETSEYVDWARTSGYLGNLVAQSGSPALMRDFAAESFKYADQKGMDSFVSGGLRALSGDPAVLNEWLASKSETEISAYLNRIDPKNATLPTPGYDPNNTAMAAFVKGLAGIQPPNDKVLHVFRDVATKYMDRAGVADAMAQVFTAGSASQPNAEFFMHRMMAVGVDSSGNAIDVAKNQQALQNFFQHTLFNSDCKLKDAVSASVKQQITDLQTAIGKYPNVDAPTKALIEATTQIEPNSTENPNVQIREQLAFRLGLFTGTAFRGFEAAVKQQGKEREELKAGVDLLFDLLPYGKAVKAVTDRIPEAAQSLAGVGESKGKDIAKNFLVDWLDGKDINKDRAEIFDMFMEFANNVPPAYYDEFASGAGHATDIDTGRNGQ